MELLRASFEIRTKVDGNEILADIELAGRTCYKSEKNVSQASSKEFVKRLIDSKHESVLEHRSLSVKFVCDRGVSHELVRHRLASFSQESTRYVNYGKRGHAFIIPCWFKGNDIASIDREIGGPTWLGALEQSEGDYNFLVSECGWTPQQARAILPNSTKTEIVVTTNLREWRLILSQRCAAASHPQMREIMIPLLKELRTCIPIIFDDIEYDRSFLG